MEEAREIPSGYLPKDRVYIPTVKFEINSQEANEQRYRDTLANTEFNAVISDLDGVILRKDAVVDDVLNPLLDKTVLNPEDSVPLAFATGRTLEEVKRIVLPKIEERLNERGKQLEEGDLTVFASNGAIGYDVATGKVLYEVPIAAETLAQAKETEALQVLLNVVEKQSQLREESGKKTVGRAKTIEDTYTFTLGLDPQRLSLIEGTDDGREIAGHFRELYGNPEDLISVVQRLNVVFEKNNIGLVATTSGAMIDINAAGVSKDLAVRVARQQLAKRADVPLSEIQPEKILSIGDSVLGNDQYVTQRKGGFSNKGPVLPGSEFPIIVPDCGDQFKNSERLFTEIKTKPVQGGEKKLGDLTQDYLVDETRLREGMPGRGIDYTFDKTGAIVLDLNTAKEVVQDEKLPESVRTFLAGHFVVDADGSETRIMTRGKGYYEAVTSTDEAFIYDKLLTINNLISELNFPEDKVLTKNEQTALLTLLDHSKALGIRLLNTELMYSQQYPNQENIKAYMEFTQRQVDNYYRTLLGVDRKPTDTTTLPPAHRVSEDDNNFREHIREMDIPYVICEFSNFISEDIKKGQKYDYVITPFYGAAELGFALRTMLELKGAELPEVIPARFSGAKARAYERQDSLFSPDTHANLSDSRILVLEDNSGTATTLRQLKDELGRYSPAVVDAAVVQAGTKRARDVIEGRKTNYNRNILEPEDIQYKAATSYDLNKRLEQLELYIKFGTLEDYMYIATHQSGGV